MNRYCLPCVTIVLAVALTGCEEPLQEQTQTDILCRSITGHRTARRMADWQFEALRDEVLKALAGGRPVAFQRLTKTIEDRMPGDLRESLQNLPESLTLVILELEVRREVLRDPIDDRSDHGPAYRLTPPVTVDGSGAS